MLLARTEPTRHMTATVITTREELATYAREWNALLRESRADTVFLTWEWISAWLNAVYPDGPLLTILVRDREGRLLGIAPFYRSKLRLLGVMKYRCLRLMGDVHCGAEYMDVIVREGFEEPVMTAILDCALAHRNEWDCIYIRNAASWTGGLDRVTSALKGSLSHLHTRRRVFSAIELPETHESYLRSLSRKHRSNIKRQEKLLSENHRVKVLCCSGEQELPKFLDTFFALHRERWRDVGQMGSFARKPPMERFYRQFATEALREGWLRILALEVDGVIQAMQYGYVYDSTFYSLQEGYAPNGMKGLGNVLRNEVIARCIKEKLRVYDFMGGSTDHKRHWGAEERWGADLFSGKRSLKNQLLFWKEIWPTGRYIREGRPANEGRACD